MSKGNIIDALSKGLLSASYSRLGENFVRVDFKCPNEANDFFRALMSITEPALDDEPENDLGEAYKPTAAEKNKRVLDLFNDRGIEIINGLPGYAIRCASGFSLAHSFYSWANCDGETGGWFRQKPVCIENARKHYEANK